MDIIQVDVLPGEASLIDPDDLKFEWQVLNYSSNRFDLSLEFQKPLYVSSSSDKEILQVKFKSEEWFSDENGQSLASGTSIEAKIPMQASSKDAKAVFDSAQSKLGSSSQTVLASNFIVNIFLSASLQYLWEMVHAQ